MARNHPQQQVTQENRHPESRNFGLKLNETDLADIEQAVPKTAVAGERYAAPLMAMLDSEH